MVPYTHVQDTNAKQKQDVRELRLLLHRDIDDERHEAVVHDRLDRLERLRRRRLPDLAHAAAAHSVAHLVNRSLSRLLAFFVLSVQSFFA